MTGYLDIKTIYRRLDSGIRDLYYTRNLLSVYIQQQEYLSNIQTTTPFPISTTSLTTPSTSTTSTTSTTPTTTPTTTLTTTPPPTISGGISGYIGGINTNFLAGNSYTLSFIPINFNIHDAQILWESNVAEPFIGANYSFSPQAGGTYWLQTEANLVDGRRVILDNNLKVNEVVNNYIELYNPNAGSDSSIKEWHKFDSSFNGFNKNGNPVLDNTSFIFPNRPSGACLLLNGVSDYLTKQIAPIASATLLSVECMLYLKQFNPNGVGNASIIRLERGWNAYIAFLQDTWSGPSINCYNGVLIPNNAINNAFPLNTWNHIKLAVDKNGYSVYINGVLKGSVSAVNAIDNFLNTNLQLILGQEWGYLDEVIIKWS